MPHLILTGHREPNPLLPFLPGFRDDFNRPNGALIATADGRPWKTAHATSGATTPRADLVIVDNAATVVVPDGATGNAVILAEARSTNVVLDVVIKTKGNQAAAILLRAVDGANCIELGLRVSSSALRPAFYSRVNGARTLLGDSPTGTTINDGDRIRIVADGPALIAYLNDVPIIAAESSLHLGRTSFGFYAYASGPGVAYDSIRAYA